MQKLEFLSWEPKITYLGVLGCRLEKLLSYLQSVPSNLPYSKFGAKNKNPLKLGLKMPDFCILGLEFEKKHCHI